MTPIRHVGRMSLERWFSFWFEIGARVFCDGVDVTNICRWFDTSTRQAELLTLDEEGRCVLSGDEVATHVVTGELLVMLPCR